MGSQYREIQLKSGLDNYIDCIWKESYSFILSKNKSPFLIVPDNTVELVFTANHIKRKDKKSGKNLCTVKSHLCGLKTRPQMINLDGEVLLSVRFKPFGLYPFTKIDLNETINQSTLPQDIFGSEILDLEDQLFNCKYEKNQLDLIEAFFLKKLYQLGKERDEVFDLFVHAIMTHKGDINIEQLSKSLSISKKTVERKFLSKLGLTPKKYCRIVRMFNALKIPENSNPQKLSTIAIDHGFYDQAHFIKEVKQFTGMTPKDYFGIDRAIQRNIFLS